MSAGFDGLINEPEPRPLVALYAAKVIVFLAALVSLPIGAVASALDFGTRVWIYAFLGLFAASLVIAHLANRWSEKLFARRATKIGLEEDEARNFWRTYDWDEADN